ncbi:MAG: TraR/DksA family transcriptional regulator [Stagnimonas sp.]|nr:TraR/DksA family transcriptional regulator [Stagnimonas sp.]
MNATPTRTRGLAVTGAATRKPPHTRHWLQAAAGEHSGDLLRLHEVLAGRQQLLSERLVRIEEDRQRRQSPLSQDFAEQAGERENDEVLDRLAEATELELAQVRKALGHIDAGDYGYCEVCDSEIAPARLAALPDATTCVRCAERAGRD